MTAPRTTINPEQVLWILRTHHAGRDNGVPVRRLAMAVLGGPPSAVDERNVRYAVATLRERGDPICAHPKHGYFFAVTSEEINETCEFLYARATHTLRQISALKRRAIPDLRGQLGMEV